MTSKSPSGRFAASALAALLALGAIPAFAAGADSVQPEDSQEVVETAKRHRHSGSTTTAGEAPDGTSKKARKYGKAKPSDDDTSEDSVKPEKKRKPDSSPDYSTTAPRPKHGHGHESDAATGAEGESIHQSRKGKHHHKSEKENADAADSTSTL